jgi:hypothetical protein
MKYCTTTTLVNPTVTICSKGIQHNLVCIFRSCILFSVIFRSSRHFLGILFKSKGKRKTNPSAGPGFWSKASRPSWLAAHGACQAERLRGGGNTSAQPATGGGTGPGACQVERSWRGQRGLTGGLCGERWMTRVRRECEGHVGQGEVCHDSPRRSGVDDAAEARMDGGVPAVVDGSRGLAVIWHRPCRVVRGRGR